MSIELYGANWVLLTKHEDHSEFERELLECAQRVWPIARTSGRRQINTQTSVEEKDRLILEAWEYVLITITRAWKKCYAKFGDGAGFDAYLMKSFQHRLGRLMKTQRMYHRTFVCEEPHKLEALAGGGPDAETDLCRQLQLQEVVARMNGWTREVWSYLLCGQSWECIADKFRMNEGQIKMKYRYSLEKIRRSMEPEKRRE